MSELESEPEPDAAPTAEAARLDEVLDGLYKAATMKGHKLPVINGADAEAVCGLFHAQVDLATEARSRAATAAGHPVACSRGCDHCCHNAPAVFAGEAVTIARWLDRPEQSEIRARFLDKYPDWRARAADAIAAWQVATEAGDVQAGADALAGVWRRQVMCAFNHEGACSIYPVRPNICRYAHAVDSSEACKPTGSGQVASMPFPPIDDFMLHIRPVVFAMHAALHRAGEGARPVCLAVHDELHRPAP